MAPSLVIDTHCYLGPWLLAEERLGMMDEAVVFSCPSNWSLPSRDNCYHTNGYIAEAQQAHPDRLIGLVCITPQFAGDAGTGMPNLRTGGSVPRRRGASEGAGRDRGPVARARLTARGTAGRPTNWPSALGHGGER